MRFLTPQEIVDEYKLPRDYVYKLLKRKDAPVLPRVANAPYLVIADEFEPWIRGLTKQ